MKNTKILFSLLIVLFVAANSCTKCPQCPEQTNIVTDDSDTLSFSIVTDDSDTLSFKMVAPVVSVNGKIEKASIVIDNVDMARMIMEKVDTAHFEVSTTPRQPMQDTTSQQQKQ